jgi:hypothetical protein
MLQRAALRRKDCKDVDNRAACPLMRKRDAGWRVVEGARVMRLHTSSTAAAMPTNEADRNLRDNLAASTDALGTSALRFALEATSRCPLKRRRESHPSRSRHFCLWC